MRYKAKQAKELMGLPKSTYATLLQRNLMMCTYPSSARGVSNEYSKSDMLRNMLFAELIKCHIGHKIAFNLIQNIDIKAESITITLGTVSKLTVNTKVMQDELSNYINKE